MVPLLLHSSFAKNHFSIAPEKAAIRALEKTIQEIDLHIYG